MIRNAELLVEWERERSRNEPPDYFRNLTIFKAMYAYARTLGVLPPADPLTGIEEKIRFAQRINVRTTIGEDGPCA